MIITKKISVENTQKKMRMSSEHVTTKKNSKTQIKTGRESKRDKKPIRH